MAKTKRKKPEEKPEDAPPPTDVPEDAAEAGAVITDTFVTLDPLAASRLRALRALLTLMLERGEIPAHRVEQLTTLLD